MTVKDISPKEAHELIEANKGNDDFMLIDVRTPMEFDMERIDGSELIDLQDPQFQQRISELDRSKKYLLYCRTGSRSSYAMNIMSQMGFEEVYNLSGGILDWMYEDYEVVN